MTARAEWAQVAHNLRALADSIDAAIEQPAAGGVVPPSRPPAPAGSARPSAPAPAAPDIRLCPAHQREWKDGQYGPYCTAKSDDPAWSNKRGYCSITPKSAPKWLEIHTAPNDAVRPVEDVDDIPF